MGAVWLHPEAQRESVSSSGGEEQPTCANTRRYSRHAHSAILVSLPGTCLSRLLYREEVWEHGHSFSTRTVLVN